MPLSEKDKLALLKIMAEEINVQRIVVNEVIAYEHPPITKTPPPEKDA